MVKKAYCDFDRYKEFKRDLHEAAFELIEIPHLRQSGKNSADIRMVVDALDLCYTKGHVDTFIILSGDSDFSPLVSKLRENAKTVVGVGVKNSTSDLFINNCDEFLYYDDLVRPAPSKGGVRSRSGSGPAGARSGGGPAGPAGPGGSGGGPAGRGDERRPELLAPEKALAMVAETLDALTDERDAGEAIWGSMIKQALKRRNPGFNERAFGFRTFNDLLHEAQVRGLLKLDADERSGGYIVRAVD